MDHPKKIGTVTTVDAETGEVVDVKYNAMTLMPPPANVCQSCAVDHRWGQPHNQQSIYWQYHFYSMHGRWPTWSDAMAHCTPEVKAFCRKKLVELMQKYGLEVPADLLEAMQGARS